MKEKTEQDHKNHPIEEKKQIRKKWLFLLLFIIVVCIGIYGFLTRETLQTTILSPKRAQVPNQTIEKIQARAHVNNQKNIGGNGILSSGFLNPLVLSKKISDRAHLIPYAYASDENLHPFIFYIPSGGASITADDVVTGDQYNVFSLEDIPNISIKNGTTIMKGYFINSSKKIVFQLKERLDSNPDNDNTTKLGLDQYRVSVEIYDIASKTFTPIATATGGGGAIANWSGLDVSPDEQYVFFFYNNEEPVDPFANVPPAPNAPAYAANSTYFFYNLQTLSLQKFKLPIQLAGAGTVTSSWQADSSSVLLGYTSLIAPFSTVFIKVFPDTHTQTILNSPTPINHYLKTQYIDSLNKVFFIGPESTDDNASIFGYYDPLSHQLSSITAPSLHSLNFLYDYTNGFIYNTYGEISYGANASGIGNPSLNYYDLTSQQSRQIIDMNLSIINFDGDYSHILVGSSTNNTNSNIYDLDIQTGALMYLTSTPYVFSPYPTN